MKAEGNLPAAGESVTVTAWLVAPALLAAVNSRWYVPLMALFALHSPAAGPVAPKPTYAVPGSQASLVESSSTIRAAGSAPVSVSLG